MTQLIVGQAAGDGHCLILAVNFHLPGGIVGDLSPPEDVVAGVLDHQPREPVVHRQGAHLAKPLTPHGMIGPGRFQLQGFHRLRLEPPLHAPDAADPVNLQGAVGISRRVGRQAAQGKTGQQLHMDRLCAVIAEGNPGTDGFLPTDPGQMVQGGAIMVSLQGRDDLQAVLPLLHLLGL